MNHTVSMQNQQIKDVASHNHLSNNCSLEKHIDYTKEKACTRINIKRRLNYDLDRKSSKIIYKSFIRPLIEYVDAPLG